MTTTKITATFADGTTATRRTATPYTHASRVRGVVRFHTSHGAAARRTRAGGEITEVVGAKARSVSACVVCEGAGTVAYGPSAVDGTYSVVPCHRCHPRGA